METQRAFVAILISMLILFGYQYFFAPTPPPPGPESQTSQNLEPVPEAGKTDVPEMTQAASPAEKKVQKASTLPPAPAQPARDIRIETSKYTAVLSENGGGFKSFQLKDYRETINEDSPQKQLILANNAYEHLLHFTWGSGFGEQLPHYEANATELRPTAGEDATLTMQATVEPGLVLRRELHFNNDSYLMEMTITVENRSDSALKGAPILRMINKPFSEMAKNRFLFQGPTLLVNDSHEEIKADDLEKGPQTLDGEIDWLAYTDTYFSTVILPEEHADQQAIMKNLDANTTQSDLMGAQDILEPGAAKTYRYKLYFGPKKLKLLEQVGSNLDRLIDFGWFDPIAKPTLFLLNFLYKFVHNYGIAIILVTILFKLLFWPISHKGMKSMKTMQKIQPKLQKLREKYKDDKERINQEMINLYRTYKINPLGGCMPMVLQIPVFFALYKVLLQTIELRHAPFMLWINDLSAPDRLMIGFDIPYLGGIPVLTLLMGASMYLQQKMTPTPADPTQAKVMLFLPVLFTFMFLNFASGLVLYWFVNNLLSIAQQYFINRQVDA